MASRLNSTTVPAKTAEAFQAASQGGPLGKHEQAHVAAGSTRLIQKRIIAVETPDQWPRFRIQALQKFIGPAGLEGLPLFDYDVVQMKSRRVIIPLPDILSLSLHHGVMAPTPTFYNDRYMEDQEQLLLEANHMTVIGPELKPGDQAPDFHAVDDSLKPVDLAATGKAVRIVSVVPSLDTPVCDAQTKRFDEEAGKLPNVSFYTLSMDLPFAQKRWCGAFGVDHVKMVSDHRSGSFGESYGTLIEDLRILSRAIFVVDKDNVIRHVEYVKEVANHPNYESALSVAKSFSGAGGHT